MPRRITATRPANGASNYAGTAADADGSEWTVDTNGSDYGMLIGFQGLRIDPESGNWYARARYESPAQGNWIQQDPLASQYQDGLNLYAAFGYNPLQNLDPDGLKVHMAADSDALLQELKDMIASMRKNSKSFDDEYKAADGSPNTVYMHLHQGKPKGVDPGGTTPHVAPGEDEGQADKDISDPAKGHCADVDIRKLDSYEPMPEDPRPNGTLNTPNSPETVLSHELRHAIDMLNGTNPGTYDKTQLDKWKAAKRLSETRAVLAEDAYRKDIKMALRYGYHFEWINFPVGITEETIQIVPK